MIALFSRWKLKNGCPQELKAAIKRLTADVIREEPGTLMYSVNLPAGHPPIGPAPEYAVSDDPSVLETVEETELIFYEVYRDAEAFSAHLRGPATAFRRDNAHHFKTPWQGHPRPIVTYLEPQSVFVQSALANGRPD